ncbi:MAG: DPP IV N-terminal domain-containing protein [Candidatus Poribacteria bacterium]|nr:DPP IV N-terminal domain-containing protein [Candidatus Poribacteria bacterium]MDE0503843.1 DPP IV N-terminal domain-containing protein [Candidatus Poribacteria bacterium]
MSFKVRRFLTAALVLSLFIQMLIAGFGYAAWRPKIAFSSTRDGDSEIYVMESDGSKQVRLTINPARDYDPSWSPDGDRIAFVSNRERGQEQIYVMDSDGGNTTRLTNDSTHQEPAWSPNGDQIAYVRNRGGRQIWIMDADGGNQTQLTKEGKNRNPAWSPDGGRIAFRSLGNIAAGLFVMEKNGSNPVRLAPNMNITSHPAWSPDGRRIAYDQSLGLWPSQIHVVDSDGGGQPERLTDNLPTKWGPTWSPDGGTIAYVHEVPIRRTTIHLMTAEGEYLKQLSEVHGGDDTDPDWFYLAGWSVSPAANFVTTWGEIKKPASARR